MTYEYKNVSINLEDDDVYLLYQLILFALDRDAEKKCLTDDERKLANRLANILNEYK